MKYRFYSKILKQILGSGYPYFLRPDGQVVIVDPKIVKKEAEYNETPHPEIGAHLCSGLQDKNNLWIYEDDIIQWGNNKGVVVFKSGCFVVEIISDIENTKPTILFKIKQEEREIIGNIIVSPLTKIQKVTVLPDFDKMKIKTK